MRRLTILLAIVASPILAEDDKTNKKPRKPYEISKETTFITGPLRKDGTVDFLKAYEEKSNAGVTPENNALTVFWKAWGPAHLDDLDKDARELYLEKLGLADLPEKGEYFVSFDTLIERMEDAGVGLEDDAYDEQSSAMNVLWKKGRFPIVERWLDANAKPIDLIVEASKRPKYYEPIAVEDRLFISSPIPSLLRARETAWALSCRAMRAAGDGKLAVAVEDLCAMRRISRLMAQDQRLISRLVARSLDHIAVAKVFVLFQAPGWTAAEVESARKKLLEFGPIPGPVESIDWAERLAILEFVAEVASGKTDQLPTQIWTDGPIRSIMRRILGHGMIDGATALRTVNSWYDRAVFAMTEKSIDERVAATEKLSAEIEETVKSGRNPLQLAGAVLTEKGRTRLFTHEIVGLSMPMLLRSWKAFTEPEALDRMLDVGLRLEAHRAKTGEYPKSLTDLGGKYLAKITIDPLSEIPFRYERRGGGYFLHSVGINGEDDLGEVVNDEYLEEHDAEDDLLFHVRKAEASKTE